MRKLFSFYLLLQLINWSMLASNPHGVSPEFKYPTDANIIGHVVEAKTGEHVPGISIQIKGTTFGTSTDGTGHYFLRNLKSGPITLVMHGVGYKSQEKNVSVINGKTLEVNFEAEEDNINLDEVVVSSNRELTLRRQAPTLVTVLSEKLFARSNAVNLAQGLVFQPGVRVENNCQNCGFNQVRINGLDGRYTQILIDSRPIMSALAGVYGLEQIPTNMIERIEMVRGGGSALFGSSAIAGVVNIITKEPKRNSFSFNESLSFTDLKAADNTINFNGSLLSTDARAGAMLFGQARYRKPWDANGDEYSELGKIDARSLGTRAYLRTSDYSKLTAELHTLSDYRRGGDRVDEPPHVVGVAEETDHSIYSGNLLFDSYFNDYKHHLQAYVSAQGINRKSYYGGVGEIEINGQLAGQVGIPLPHEHYGDNYGYTKGRTYMSGLQYSYESARLLFAPAQMLIGAEYTRDELNDVMPIRAWYTTQSGTAHIQLYPEIDQKINNYSLFAQNEWKTEAWSLLIGGRLDKHSEVKDLIFSPRATLRYNPSNNANLRATYAKGFRAPQIFDEDLHVGLVGGEAQKIINDPNLKPEISHAFSLSADLYHNFGELQANLLIEGFYTRLDDVFTNIEQASQHDGIKRYTRVNGKGAKVLGANIEAKLAYQAFQIQTGLTLASNRYDEAQEWGLQTETDGQGKFVQEANSEGKLEYVNQSLTDKRITRTPNVYGYFTIGYNPIEPLSLALTGTYTGKMYIPHAIEYGVGAAESDIAAIAAGLHQPEVDETDSAPRLDELKQTPAFFDLGMKIAYDFNIFQSSKLQLYAGMLNVFNSFQRDCDRGPSRDSGYMYGPTQPRTLYMGCKFSF